VTRKESFLMASRNWTIERDRVVKNQRDPLLVRCMGTVGFMAGVAGAAALGLALTGTTWLVVPIRTGW